MAPRSTRAAALVALALCAGCTIERTRQLGDDCLMDRECAAGLRCQISSDGTSRCVAPVRFDVPLLPGVDATPDVAPDVAPDTAQDEPPADALPPRDASVDDADADS